MRTLHRVLTLCVIAMVQFVPPVSAQVGSKFVDIPDVNVGVSVTLIRAANSARIVLLCTNTSAGSAIRVGGSTVSATRGARLAPGGIMMITASADIFGFSEADIATISCTEELR